MTDYREIIRLKSLEFSNVAIANSLGCSRNTVSEVLKLAETHSLGWAIPDALSNTDIEHLFLKYLSLQKHILWDGLSLMHCQTLTSSICF